MPEERGRPTGLDALAERKRELLLESEINRQILRVEFAQLGTKAEGWKRSLLRFGSVYKYLAPASAVFMAAYGIRKKVKEQNKPRFARNNSGDRDTKASVLAILAPLGLTAVKQAMGIWRQMKSRRTEA
jgi:hypothetical protein